MVNFGSLSNSDGEYLKTLENATKLYHMLIKAYPTIKKIKQHNHWSGINCPRLMRQGHKGVNWNEFVKRVKSEVDLAKPIKPVKPPYVTTNTEFKIGETVRVKKSAKGFATGESIANFVKGNTYKILQRRSNRMLLDGIMSWVKTNDLEKLSGGSRSRKPSTSKKSNKVTLKKSASRYVTGERIPSRYKGKSYTVMQGRSNQVLLKKIKSWVYKKDVSGYSSSSSKGTSSNKQTPKSFKIGSKVRIKSSAKKYSRSNTNIPSKYKGKSYTIQQVGNNDVLLKELYSWVRKSNLH